MKHKLDWFYSAATVLAMLAAAPACGLTNNEDNDSTAGEGDDAGDSPDGDGDGGTVEAATVYDVQRGDIAEGTVVRFENVVIASPVWTDPESGNGTVLVQEQDGGEYSGIAVFMFADVSDVTTLRVGDQVNLTGEYTEFFDFSEVTVSNAADIEVVGAGTLPAPAVVTASDVSTGGPLAEAYEAVVVQINDAEVTDPDIGFGDFEIGGSLIVDDYFMPPLLPAPGSRFDSLTGALMYSFEEYRLAPRDMNDVRGGEFGASEASVYEIRMGMVEEGALVQVNDIVVTSPTNFEGDLFFAQEQDGGEFSGIGIFIPEADSLGLGVGDVISVQGRYEEFFDLSEISVYNVADITVNGTAAVPGPAVVDAAEIATGGQRAEPYEGVLVSVTGVTVMVEPNEFGEFRVDDDLIVDDLFFRSDDNFPRPAVDDAYSEIVGVLVYSFEETKLSPRTLEDFQ